MKQLVSTQKSNLLEDDNHGISHNQSNILPILHNDNINNKNNVHNNNDNNNNSSEDDEDNGIDLNNENDFETINWKYERLLWIAYYKNMENNKCFCSQMSKDIICEIITMIFSKYNAIFTCLNGIEDYGPTSIDNYYNNQCHKNDVILDNNGCQIWTVPKSGIYNIIAYGASGGDTNPNDCYAMPITDLFFLIPPTDIHLYGGLGAKVGGSLRLNKNDKIKILVGQMGQDAIDNAVRFCEAGGGGGGTFIVRTDKLVDNNNNNNVEPLIIAAGGNGACNCHWKVNGINGLAIECNNRDKYGGYISDGWAGRGASFYNDFDRFKSYNNITYKEDFNKCNPNCFVDSNQCAIGGQGAAFDYNEGCVGGFGGGGGSWREGGGGGGYIGGLVANHSQFKSSFDNYGALSFNKCKNNRIMQSGVNKGNGKVEIKWIKK